MKYVWEFVVPQMRSEGVVASAAEVSVVLLLRRRGLCVLSGSQDAFIVQLDSACGTDVQQQHTHTHICRKTGRSLSCIHTHFYSCSHHVYTTDTQQEAVRNEVEELEERKFD